jgi:hypothetical protein
MQDSTDKQIAGRTLIFLGGLHRSGTSLLHEVLRDSCGCRGLFADRSWPLSLETRAGRFGYSLTEPRLSRRWDDWAPEGKLAREDRRRIAWADRKDVCFPRRGASK